MNDRTLANRYRPKQFVEMVGQESEVEVMKKIVAGVLMPPAILFYGPWGTGKTSSARLVARAMFCSNRQDAEPCGVCPECKSMEAETHPGYIELDAASKSGVKDVREVKDLLEYRATGSLRVIVFDESHMLSDTAQNAMLQMLEEGLPNVVLMFCTTDAGAMLTTIRSRCIELRLKLLTHSQITNRLRDVVKRENVAADDKALRIIGTYVRGHLRDALMLLQQLIAMGEVTEQLTRTYLRLDDNVVAYEFLLLREKRDQITKLEELLCTYSSKELQEILGQSLLNAYKLTLGVGSFSEVDEAWLKRVASAHGDTLLKKAEQVLSLNVDFSSINHATATFARVFAEDVIQAPTQAGGTSLMPAFRKPKAE